MITRRKFGLTLASAAVLGSVSAPRVQAKTPITMIVPNAAGGSTDIIGRIFANSLESKLGEAVIVENRPGANHQIGGNFVARSPTDGRTMLYSLGNLLLNSEFLTKGSPFHPLEILTPVCRTCSLRVAIVAAAANPANDLREFIALAKAAPGKRSYAFYGDLGTAAMAAEANIDLLRVPYKGGNPGLIDVVSGNVDIVASSLTQAIPMLQAKRAKLLAVISDRRWADYPDVPTVKEILPNFSAIDYQGIFLPIKTPQDKVDGLWKAVSEIIAAPDFVRGLEARGAVAAPLSPSEFKTFSVADRLNIKKIVEVSGIQPE